MRKRNRRFYWDTGATVILIIVLMVLSCLPFYTVIFNNIFAPRYTPKKAEKIELKEMDGSSYHYYNGLNDNQKKLYRSIVDDIERYESGQRDAYTMYEAFDDDPKILSRFSQKKFKLSDDEVDTVIAAVLHDNPAICFYTYSVYHNKIFYYIAIDEDNSKTTSKETKDAIATSVSEVEALLEGVSDERDRFEIIYSYVINNVEYQYDSNKEPLHTYYSDSYIGALDQNDKTGAVCGGYVFAVVYLSNHFDIDCIYFASDHINHAYAVSKIDGKWYYSDPTFDDGKKTYKNFLLNAEDFWDYHYGGVNADPTPTQTGHYWCPSLPNMAETSYSYEKVGNLLLQINDEKTYYTVVNCLDKNATTVQIPTEHNGIPVTTIGPSAFEESSIVVLEIPNSIHTINSNAFYYCDSLCYVQIPSSVTYIAKNAFSVCYNLVELTVEDEDFYKSLVSEYNEIFNNAYIIHHGKIPTMEERSCKVENDFVFFTEGANRYYLQGYIGDKSEIELPSTYKGKSYTISKYAFKNSRLKSIIIPDNISIEPFAFYNSKELVSISLPSTLNIIPEYSFYYCTSLKSVTIPNSTRSIDKSAFGKCTSLSELVLPDSLEVINKNAFYGCEGLVAITIPKGVSTIDTGAFLNCTSLKEFVVSDENEAFCDLDGVLFAKDKTKLYQYPPAKDDKVFTFPDEFKSYVTYAFYNCNSIEEFAIDNNPRIKCVDGVIYSANMKTLYFYPQGKRDLTFTVPEGVETISIRAFATNQYIMSVTLADSVKEIKTNAFEECASLIQFTFGKNLTTIASTAFNDTMLIELYDLRDVNKSLFYQSSIMKTHKQKEDSILEISNDLVFATKNEVKYLVKYVGSSSELYLPSDFKYYINSYAFYGNTCVKEIHIPNTVIQVLKYAFYDSSLEKAHTVDRWYCSKTQHIPISDASMVASYLTEKYAIYNWIYKAPYD